MGSADRSEQDLNTGVNRPASFKLIQSTTLSSKYKQLYYPITWCTRYFDWWSHLENCPSIVNHIKWLQTIHGVLLALLHWKLWGWVIDIDSIIFFVILNNKSYIFCYCILEYYDDITFDMNVSYISLS